MIKTSLYKAKQGILHKINPERCNFVLLEKTKDINIAQYKKMSNNVPEGADIFTLVSIGKKNDSKYRKKITTFYKDKLIIQRLTETSDGERIIREYEYRGYDVKNSNTKSKKIVQKKFNPETSKFETNLIEEQKTYKSETTKKTKLQINKNGIDGDIINATITEFPFNKSGKHLSSLKKIIGLKMKLGEGQPVIKETFETTNVKFPINDKFLPYRFIIDTHTRLIELTKHFIREKHLEKLGIRIDITDNIAKNTSGYFSELENRIAYNINGLGDLADLSAHEVEHAYQYCEIGRLGKGRSPYSRNSRKLFGRIDGLKENMEANKYAVAAEKYPNLTDEEDLSKNLEYKNNYLEVKAREAGQKAKEEYQKLGKELSEQFFFGVY